jgi:hypothetical protein
MTRDETVEALRESERRGRAVEGDLSGWRGVSPQVPLEAISAAIHHLTATCAGCRHWDAMHGGEHGWCSEIVDALSAVKGQNISPKLVPVSFACNRHQPRG